MTLTVIGVGLIGIVILAIVIGEMAGRQARNAAWRRIAAERRRNWEMRQFGDATCDHPDCPADAHRLTDAHG